jgi:hypothetical protein
MSYKTISRSANDPALIERIVGGTVAEAWNNPATADSEYGRNVRASEANARRMIYPVVVAADVESAYASALAGGNPDPGGDEAVITDGMILANVQAKWPADPV